MVTGFHHLERTDGRTTTFQRLVGQFGMSLITLALIIASHVLSIDVNLDMEAAGLNTLARSFSTGQANIARYVTHILFSWIACEVTMSAVSLATLRLFRWAGAIEAQGGAGPLRRIIRPRADQDTVPRVAESVSMFGYTMTLTGIALDAGERRRTGHGLINWKDKGSAVCIYGVFILVTIGLFFFVRVDIVGGVLVAFVSRLGKFVLMIALLAYLCKFMMQATYNHVVMQRQFLDNEPNYTLPFDRNAASFRGFGPDQPVPETRTMATLRAAVEPLELNGPAGDAAEDDDDVDEAAEMREFEEPEERPIDDDADEHFHGFRFSPWAPGTHSYYLRGWRDKFLSLTTKVQRYRWRYFEGPRAARERDDWSMRLPLVIAFFAGFGAMCFTFLGCVSALGAMLLGIEQIYLEIQALQGGGPLPAGGPFWMVYVIHFPIWMPFKSLPPVALSHLHPEFLIIFRMSLICTLGALVSIRATPVYLLLVLVDTLHHRWRLGSAIPDGYLTVDGGRFDLDRVLIYEPPPRRIIAFLIRLRGFLRLIWQALIKGFAYQCGLYGPDGTLVPGTVASRRSATLTAAPAMPLRIHIHTTADTYQNPPAVAPGVVHVLDIRLLLPRLRHLSNRDLFEAMRRL